MHKRILLLGTTGIKKSLIAENVKKVSSQSHAHDIKIINFEKKYFNKSSHFRNMQSFLTLEKSMQHQIWNDAWDYFSKEFDKDSSETIILVLHGVYVNESYGVRALLGFNDVCKDFNPSLIITLIDDIYNIWHRTESSAGHDKNRGRPTFEQLLMGRRTEVIIGDLIASQNSLSSPARHIVCSVNHPIETIVKLILFDAKIVYLSFPISAPRKLAKQGDNSFIEAIDDLHNLAIGRNCNNIIYISPLAMDELPLCLDAEDAINIMEENIREIQQDGNLETNDKKQQIEQLIKNTTVTFDLQKRWSLDNLWNSAELLCNKISETHSAITIPLSQLQNICGIIKTDVGWRDYKLVDQADCLAIFCPIPPGRTEVTRGVSGEWQKAALKSIPCYVYQKSEWDPDNKIKAHTEDVGAMGDQPMASHSLRVKNKEDLYKYCENYIKEYI